VKAMNIVMKINYLMQIKNQFRIFRTLLRQ